MTVEAKPLVDVPNGDDERRHIREVVVYDADGNPFRVTQIEAHGHPTPLGQHYHPKPEEFHIVFGTFTLYTLRVEGPDTQADAQLLVGPMFLTIAPGVAHSFVPDGPGLLVSRMAGEFDPADNIPFPLV